MGKKSQSGIGRRARKAAPQTEAQQAGNAAALDPNTEYGETVAVAERNEVLSAEDDVIESGGVPATCEPDDLHRWHDDGGPPSGEDHETDNIQLIEDTAEEVDAEIGQTSFEAVVKKILDTKADTLGALAGRWQDEKEYEDFAQYEGVMRNGLPEAVVFIRGTKSPFGMVVKIDDQTVHFFVKGDEVRTGILMGEKHSAVSAAVAAPAPSTKKAKPMPTFDEALAAAREANPNRYLNVLEVTELTKDGDPKRVVIRCTDPQTKQENGKDVSVCAETREIAVQDLFQVVCCAPCADRKVRKARRNRAKAKIKAVKKAIQAAKGGR